MRKREDLEKALEKGRGITLDDGRVVASIEEMDDAEGAAMPYGGDFTRQAGDPLEVKAPAGKAAPAEKSAPAAAAKKD